jgi:two-component system, OmpR family, response regulator
MRVLIIEDEHKIARALQKALTQETYAVDICFTSDDGLAMATTEPYDVMIIDRMLPGGSDGLSIVKELRALGIHTPVLLLTAMGSIQDKTDGLDGGADDYLAKPFALTELLARVRALLRRPAEQQSTVLTVGDLSLNTVTFAVERAGRSLSLTSKEFALLEFMMRNPGRPLSKEVIVGHVWDYDADILPNTVEVYIKYLRKKIEVPGTASLIHTVRGFGYTLGEKA